MSHPVQMIGSLLPEAVASQEMVPDAVIGSPVWEDDGGLTSDAALIAAVSTQTNSDWILPSVPGLLVCGSTENDSIEFGLDNRVGADPYGLVDTVRVECHMRYDLPIGGGGTATARMRLREGTTTRATRTGINLTTSFVEYDDLLSAAEIDAISDWDNLRIIVDADVCVDTIGDEISFEVSQMRLDIN